MFLPGLDIMEEPCGLADLKRDKSTRLPNEPGRILQELPRVFLREGMVLA
jgi:hypothetical protein